MLESAVSPVPEGVRPDQWDGLASYLADGGLVALTGAGLSTESGLPSYRDARGVRRVQPMTVSELRASHEARQRYWARSYVGWPRFAAARPNDGHRAVARLLAAGTLTSVITQNVDGLHQAAGASEVLELHGNLERVVCMACSSTHRRDDMDDWLRDANPGFDRAIGGAVRPDGDVALPEAIVRAFVTADCPVCGSDLLKPDVVMFGESVPKPLVEQCFGLVEEASALLVLGSSLAVMSGYRFVRRAARIGVPVIVINDGWTRGDGETDLKIEAPLGSTLTALADRLGAPAVGAPGAQRA
ncbi:NAD-dependent protein deacetylase [Allobranchiibius sp. GilTou38]|uniref:NAD-dependent protein deacetylase n=1 Tax=Allobranchiibius sp. GilTou38 TaxID=2815210 RepID=UPI003260DC77